MSGRSNPVADEAFAAAWRAGGGSPTRVAEITGTTIREVYRRRERLATRGILLNTTPIDGRITRGRIWSTPSAVKPQRQDVNLANGCAVVFSDAHYWPGVVTVAHKALLSTIRTLRPALVIANGDIFDGSSISRHGRNGWEQQPTPAQELAASKERMDEIEDAAGVDCELIWTLGNHDQRLENYFSANAGAMEGMPGVTLPEHFPRWTFCMSAAVNWDGPHPVMVKHRYANGMHAAYNNTLRAGMSIVTGHLHRLTVTTWGDYRGRRYGVDTGTLADPGGPQFNYAEDNPTSGGSGFAVLTFHDGDMAPPELCETRGDVAYFRGHPVALG